MMQIISSPVKTIGYRCASSVAIILCFEIKCYRFVKTYCRIMIHEPFIRKTSFLHKKR